LHRAFPRGLVLDAIAEVEQRIGIPAVGLVLVRIEPGVVFALLFLLGKLSEECQETIGDLFTDSASRVRVTGLRCIKEVEDEFDSVERFPCERDSRVLDIIVVKVTRIDPATQRL